MVGGNPRTGTFMETTELPQNRDRLDPSTPDGLLDNPPRKT
jgi:hypothetical protein